MKNVYFILLLILLTPACSTLQFAVVNAPTYAFKGQIKENIAYGKLDSQTLDIFIPDKEAANYPVVIFLHGGRWTSGNKDQYAFVGMTLADLGYVAVIPNTRLYPQVKFPTFIEDSAHAIAWVHNNIEQYGGNRDIFLSGHSSGAHMGALVLADATYLAQFGLAPNIINAFAGMSGPYDFEPETEDLKDIFGPPSEYAKMVVTNFIDGNEPPMLLIHTADDKTVHPRNLEKLRLGISTAGGVVNTLFYESGEHASTVAAFSWANPSGLPVPQDIDRFFKAYLKDKSNYGLKYSD